MRAKRLLCLHQKIHSFVEHDLVFIPLLHDTQNTVLSRKPVAPRLIETFLRAYRLPVDVCRFYLHLTPLFFPLLRCNRGTHRQPDSTDDIAYTTRRGRLRDRNRISHRRVCGGNRGKRRMG